LAVSNDREASGAFASSFLFILLMSSPFQPLAKPALLLLTALLLSPAAHAAVSGTPPPGRKDLIVDETAMVQEWVLPVYPESALKEKIGGRVVIRIVVDADGAITTSRVLNSVDPRLDEAVLTMLKQWKFSPATENGKRIPWCLDVPVVFDPVRGAKAWRKGLLPDAGMSPISPSGGGAEPKNTPPGDYPATLKDRKLAGWVRFSCRVTKDGRPSDPKIMGASHVDFVLPALTALKTWDFTPAKQGDLVKEGEVKGEVAFDDYTAKPLVVLSANQITGPEGAEPSANPQILASADAVWPTDLLLAGTGGEAVVQFTVSDEGDVKDAKVQSATKPEFGEAALAAIQMWYFRPGMSDGRGVATSLWKKFTFKPTEADAKDDEAVLMRDLRDGKIADSRGLDEQLTPIRRVSPIYPVALIAAGKPEGSAQIEFVIARDGRARLPRIVSATHPEFGWAAATALSQWVFKAPLREGKPVDVRVRIPVSFTPPN
jgi:TonB family protein